MKTPKHTLDFGNLIAFATGTGVSPEVIERLRWLEYYSQSNSAQKTCDHFGIARSTFYRWLQRFDPQDLSTLEDHPTSPVTSASDSEAVKQTADFGNLIAFATGAGVSPEVIERLRWLEHYSQSNSAQKTCDHFGIARSTFYRWLQRFDPQDLSTLEDHPTSPVTSASDSEAVKQTAVQPNLTVLVRCFIGGLIINGLMLIALLWSNFFTSTQTITLSANLLEQTTESDTHVITIQLPNE